MMKSMDYLPRHTVSAQCVGEEEARGIPQKLPEVERGGKKEGIAVIKPKKYFNVPELT